MNKLVLAAALVGLIAASSVQADIGPPKGMKRVTLDHKITTEKEWPDYIFFTVLGGGGKGGLKNPLAAAEGVTQVTFDPKTPIEIKGANRGGGIGRQGSFVAVPKDAAKGYDSEKAFLAAIRNGKVEGQLRAKGQFDSTTTIKDTDPRTTVVWEFKVEKVDPKEGLVGAFVRDAEAKNPEKKDPAKKDTEGVDDDEEVAVAAAPKGGVWVAGLAATLGLVFAGMWLAGRRNRHG